MTLFSTLCYKKHPRSRRWYLVKHSIRNIHELSFNIYCHPRLYFNKPIKYDFGNGKRTTPKFVDLEWKSWYPDHNINTRSRTIIHSFFGQQYVYRRHVPCRHVTNACPVDELSCSIHFSCPRALVWVSQMDLLLRMLDTLKRKFNCWLGDIY